jgi:signal transduction histidine kinase
MYKSLLLLILSFSIFFKTNVANAQSNEIDSLLQVINKLDDEGQQIRSYEKVVFAYSSQNKYDSAHYYIDRSIEIANDIKDKTVLARALGIKGKMYRYESRFEKSLKVLKESYDLAKKLGEKKIIMSVSNDLGVTYRRIAEEGNALNYHLEAYKIAEELNDVKNLAVASNSIGIIYTYQGQYDEALQYFNKALALEQERNNSLGIAINLNSIAWIYELEKNYNKAIEYYKKSLDVNERSNNQKGIVICYSDLGKVYHTIGEYKLSLEYYNKTLEFNKKLDDKRYIARSHIYLGEVYRDLGDIEKSLMHLKDGLKFALQIKTNRMIMLAYEQLSYTYEKSNNPSKAITNFKNYNIYKDSVLNEEKAKQIIEMQTRYESERKEQENVLLKNENKLNESQIQRQRIAVFAIVSILLLITSLVFVLLTNRRKQKKAIVLLGKQNHEILNQKEEIQEQAHELEKAINTKNRFFSIIAHDLINPFHAIIGYSNLLKTSYDTLSKEKITEYIELISQTSSQAHELLINLLEWSLAQTNTIEFEPQVINIDEILIENIELLTSQAKRKSLELEFVPKNKAIVYADLNMMQTVVRNLISNAIKFTKIGKVVVTYEIDSDFCRISVKDTGVGISEQNLKNLFKIDKTVSSKGTSGENGTGIGLILCKEFIQKNGGEIFVTSKPEEGSEFVFTLPLSK